MHYTFKQLRYFESALRHRSIARAAEEMNISQSSITAAIDVLEAAVGTQLFRRIPAKGIVPTDTGRDVGERTTRFLEQCRIFDSELMSIEGKPAGTLRIACYAPTAPYVLPPLLKRLAARYPDIRIDLREGDMQSIADLLHSGNVDVALTYRTRIKADQPFLSLFRARPFVLLPSASPLVAKAALEMADLDGMPMVLLDLPSTLSYFRDLFTRAGLEPRIVHTTQSSSVLRGMVGAHLGYSIMNIRGHADRFPEAGYVTRPLLGDVYEPEYGVAYAQEAQSSAVLRAVLEISDDLIASGYFDQLMVRPE